MAQAERKSKRKKYCGNCGLKGHSIRVCPQIEPKKRLP